MSFFYGMAQKRTDSPKNDLIPKGGGSPSREVSYQYAAQFTQEAFDKVVGVMRTSRNENIVLGAAKVILDRTLPEIKARELTGKDGEAITVNVISDYLSKPVVMAAPKTGFEGLGEVQGSGVAQESKENIDLAGEASLGGI